jgi:hypothetical protein
VALERPKAIPPGRRIAHPGRLRRRHADEATVNTLLANRIKIYRKVTDPLRQRIDHNASTCRNDYFVSEKAREALGLLSEFESILDSLQSKLGGAG